MTLIERQFEPTTAELPVAAPLLECRGVCKRFGAVEALVDVDFDVFPGEVVALVGDNGAGKSTLIKAISGTQPADRGSFRFEGRDVTIRNPSDANRLGIETVYQDLALCDNLDTVANLYLGRELGGPAHLPPWLRVLAEPTMEERANERLGDLGVTTIESVRERVGALSGGQRQAVAVAKATLWKAKLVILDEPTAALGVSQTAQVLQLIRRLRDSGLGVVVITHNIDVVFEVADRIVVLRVGRRVATFEQRATTPQEVVGAIVGIDER
ncbi:MAG TPA: ATP-binding cassette domain-containing protein [Solirubrobacteraceae bacterium]|nr:ATP-binding cassette domain-containing protein [Solirubrobacteraceae bacterium]